MSKAYSEFIAVTKQQVKFYQSPFLKMSKKEAREQGSWVLAGIHQAALFVLSEEEYYKFTKEYNKLAEYFLSKKEPEIKDQNLEGQMTIMDLIAKEN